MQITLHASSLILWALIAQGVFAALLLPFQRGNRRANRFLALLILLLALWLCDAFFRVAGIYQQNPNFYFLPIYFSLAFGPLIFLYTRALTRPDFRFRWRHVWHFGPALLQGAGYLFLQSQDYAFRREFWLHIHRPYTYDGELVLSFAALIFYLVGSLRYLRQYRRQVANYYSSLHRITLSWLRTLHLVLSFLAAFWLVEAVARLAWAYYPATPFSAITIGGTMLFLAVGGLLQQDLTPVAGALEAEAEPQANGSTAVDPVALDHIQAVMADQRLYRQQELTLRDFARALDLPSREVSRLINVGLGLTFIDFVNQHRVAEVKARIIAGEADRLSLLGIAEACGFNSKSTFYRVFRNQTGQSPAEFLKEVSTHDLGPSQS